MYCDMNTFVVSDFWASLHYFDWFHNVFKPRLWLKLLVCNQATRSVTFIISYQFLVIEAHTPRDPWVTVLSAVYFFFLSFLFLYSILLPCYFKNDSVGLNTISFSSARWNFRYWIFFPIYCISSCTVWCSRVRSLTFVVDSRCQGGKKYNLEII